MKCPGQDMKYWKAGAIFEVQCPKCSTPVEFYKDDTSRKCGNCGHRFVNPNLDFGCASYCPYAEQCLGALPEDFTGARENLLKDKVAVEMKRFFQTDFKRIRQATTTAKFVEHIGKTEGGNLAVLLCAAYLHDTGLTEAEAILNKIGASQPMVREICTLLLHDHRGNEDDTLQAKILHDALLLRQIQEELKENPPSAPKAQQASAKKFFTNSAKEIAATLID